MINYTVRPGEEVSLETLLSATDGQEVRITVPAGATATIVDSADFLSVAVTLVLLQDAQAAFAGRLVLRDGQQAQRSITVQCTGRGGSATVEVSCHTQGSSQFALTTIQNHAAPHTSSNVRILGVSAGSSRASVQSTIFIAPDVRGVAAHQVHKHLLLDAGARATSVPALDILSDDVSCSHGAAITHLDTVQLFYLQARGYGVEEARDAMVKAFLRG